MKRQLLTLTWGWMLTALLTGAVFAAAPGQEDHAAPWRVPQPGSIKTYTQEAIDKKDDLFPILNEVFGR